MLDNADPDSAARRIDCRTALLAAQFDYSGFCRCQFRRNALPLTVRHPAELHVEHEAGLCVGEPELVLHTFCRVSNVGGSQNYVEQPMRLLDDQGHRFEQVDTLPSPPEFITARLVVHLHEPDVVTR
ncbi:hypothetical protein [Nocardioides rubriscoriae]|uniref:hypothetical protein n=1 Tax=Nocardioides rubriscoriae TaxID=642762 RepID=UPI0011DF5E6B|nr:hypothetical protein [Nocardioides rubriscoriae]